MLAFLADNVPEPEVFKAIGRAATIVTNLRLLTRGHRDYVNQIARVYKRYRREHSDFYLVKPNSQHISSTELDAVILLTLKNTHDLLAIPFVSGSLSEPRFNYLAIISSRFRLQIFVDEATDFSELQLAAMQLLTHPSTQSFFACGDFNQRLTQEGIKQQSDLRGLPFTPDFRRITTVYRQSKRLNDFSCLLLALSGGDETAAGELPEDYNHPGVAPLLIEGVSEPSDIARWLAERIEEVESSVNVLQPLGY